MLAFWHDQSVRKLFWTRLLIHLFSISFWESCIRFKFFDVTFIMPFYDSNILGLAIKQTSNNLRQWKQIRLDQLAQSKSNVCIWSICCTFVCMSLNKCNFYNFVLLLIFCKKIVGNLFFQKIWWVNVCLWCNWHLFYVPIWSPLLNFSVQIEQYYT